MQLSIIIERYYRFLFLFTAIMSASVTASQQVALRSEAGRFYLYNIESRSVTNADTPALAGVTANLDWKVQAFADLNGDGDSDLLMRNEAGAWFVYLIKNGAVMDSGAMGITANSAWEFKATGDFNGDGSADVLLRNISTGNWFVYLLDGLSIPSSGAVNLAFNQDWRFQGVADFDGDGISDVLLRHQVNQSWFLYALDGIGLNQSNTGLIRFALNPNWEFAAADDFTGDGKADLIMRRKDGPWWMYQVDGTEVLNNSNFGLLAFTENVVWEFKGASDLNGDGRSDVLLKNGHDGRWYVYALNGRTKVDADTGSLAIDRGTTWVFSGVSRRGLNGANSGGDTVTR